MTTDGGGWTIISGITGADGEQPLVSNTEVVNSNPIASTIQAYNINRAKKKAISQVSNESVFVREGGTTWLKVNSPIFDPADKDVETASQDWDGSGFRCVTNDSNEDTSCAMGWSNYNNASGGDFGIVNTSFDHHSTAYRHLNGGCVQSYIYSFSNTDGDSDAGYDSNTALGPSWTVTNSCDGAEGGALKFYTGMRKVNHSISIFGDDNDGRKYSNNTFAVSCNGYKSSSYYKGDIGDGVYWVDPDGSGGSAEFKVYCDMTTESGGWTIFSGITGADGEESMVSNTAVSGNPLGTTIQEYNLTRAQKRALSIISNESLFVKEGKAQWLKVNYPAFGKSGDTNITGSATHWDSGSVTCSAQDGTQDTSCTFGWSTTSIPSGGSFGVNDGTFDHHSTSYNHLNGSCSSQYLYDYSAGTADSDAGYDVNLALGNWSQTSACQSAEGGVLKIYSGLR